MFLLVCEREKTRATVCLVVSSSRADEKEKGRDTEGQRGLRERGMRESDNE